MGLTLEDTLQSVAQLFGGTPFLGTTGVKLPGKPFAIGVIPPALSPSTASSYGSSLGKRGVAALTFQVGSQVAGSALGINNFQRLAGGISANFLVFLVNPQQIKYSYANSVDFHPTRNPFDYEADSFGYTVNHHWPKGDKISIKARTGSFIGKSGLVFPFITNESKRETIAHDNFRKILAIFRNNGTSKVSGFPGLINGIGGSYIFYDGVLMQGYWSSFNFEERGDMPFNIEFSLEFVANSVFDINDIEDVAAAGLLG